MARAQDTYDAFVRHAVGLKRLDITQSNLFAENLSKELRQLEEFILNRGVLGKNITAFQRNRLEDLIEAFSKRYETVFNNLRRGVETSLTDIAVYESEFVQRILNKAFPIDISLNIPTQAQIQTAFQTTPTFIGKTLFSRRHFRDNNMWDDLSRRTRLAITNTTRSAFLNGSSLSSAKSQLRAVYPTASNNAKTFMRTALQFSANTSRLLTFEQNKDIITRLRYSAVLDGRTTDICASLDGLEYVIGRDVIREPPTHFSCRSTLVPITSITDYNSLERRFQNTTERNSKIFSRLRREAKQKGVEYKPYRDNYFKDKIGRVKLKETYPDFFRRQNSDFQRTVLGPRRYNLYKEKGLSYKELINPRTERFFTVRDLRRIYDK